MRYKLNISLIILFIVVIISYLIFLDRSEKDEKNVTLSKNLYTNLKIQQQESSSILGKKWGKSPLYNPINAIQGSKDEYTTYYAYQTISLLGENPSKNYCNIFQQTISKDSFPKEEEGLIFTGIERVYRAQKSMELCLDINQQTMNSLFQKHIKYLLKNTYINNGYFISEEFIPYKDKTGYEEVKIQQTYMILYLASNYGLLDEIDLKKVKMWVEKISLNDLIIIDTLENINEILNVDTNIKVNINQVSSLLNKKKYEFNDLMGLNSLIHLAKKGYVQIDSSMVNNIKDKLKSYHYSLSDIQSEYLKNSILKNLNHRINKNEKESILKDIITFTYDDGMLPTFSSYSNPFSPSLVGRLSEEFSASQQTPDDKEIVDILKSANITDFVKLEPFEIYSYTSLFNLTNSRPTATQKKKLNKILIKKIKQPIDRGTLMGWSYYVKSYINLNGQISTQMLPKNTKQILNYIIKSKRSYFEKNDEISTLVFLETLANTNLYNEEISKTKSFINKVDINENSEILSYLIYYKTMLQEKLNLPYDKNKVAAKINTLYKRSGYSLNAKEDFPNIYSTYFIMNVNHELTEDYNNE